MPAAGESHRYDLEVRVRSLRLRGASIKKTEETDFIWIMFFLAYRLLICIYVCGADRGFSMRAGNECEWGELD